MTWLLLSITAAILGADPVTPEGEADAAPTAADVRTILATPRGSLSFGTTNAGHLSGAKRLPHKGRGWSILTKVRSRRTNHGTDEMVAFLRRVAGRVRDAHRGATVGLGNISVKEGGKTPWHVSHQAGRDVDIVLFGLTAKGRSVNPDGFVTYDEQGRSLSVSPRLTFDVERNLAVVRALLEDDEVAVQWIFIADYLKTMLLDEARSQGLRPELLERMEAVLHQPSDSNPHANHFHVRIYCSVQDRLHGCRERGPIRPWAELGDDAFAARVGDLVRVLSARAGEHRAAALEALGDLRARAAIPHVVARLADGEGRVRAAALSTLRRIGDPLALPGVLGALARADDAAWARELLRAVYALRSPELISLALALLDDPARFVSETVRGDVIETLESIAARILERDGRKPAVPALLALLRSPSSKVRAAADAALVRVTNHTVKGDPSSRKRSRRERAVEAWDAFWTANETGTWITWLAAGLRTAGYRLDSDLATDPSLRAMIAATGDKRSHISHNAVRLLGEVTGHVQDPYGRSARNQRRHYERWWELRQEATTGGEANAP